MTTATERQILEQEIGRLQDEGYDVFVKPRPPVAPAFLRDFVPDAIALGPRRNIVLEVQNRDSAANPRLREIARLVQEQPGWELRLVWIEPLPGAGPLRVQAKAEISRAIDEVAKLLRDGSPRAAFLLGWAALEASSRAVETETFARPQTPGRLIEILGREGYVGPSMANALRRLSEKRNQLVHGVLDADVTRADVDTVLDVLASLLGKVAA